jgi:hypothetical protein
VLFFNLFTYILVIILRTWVIPVIRNHHLMTTRLSRSLTSRETFESRLEALLLLSTFEVVQTRYDSATPSNRRVRLFDSLHRYLMSDSNCQRPKQYHFPIHQPVPQYTIAFCDLTPTNSKATRDRVQVVVAIGRDSAALYDLVGEVQGLERGLHRQGIWKR